MLKPFAVLVSDLMNRPAARREVMLAGRLGRMATGTASVPAGANVVVSGLLEWVQDGVLFTGSVASTWVSECRRCLAEVRGPMNAEVQELYWARPPDSDSSAVVYDSVDLGPMASEALILELPLTPLCRPDCAGLCGWCGADLNSAELAGGPCGCRRPEPDPRWAALDVLRVD